MGATRSKAPGEGDGSRTVAAKAGGKPQAGIKKEPHKEAPVPSAAATAVTAAASGKPAVDVIAHGSPKQAVRDRIPAKPPMKTHPAAGEPQGRARGEVEGPYERSEGPTISRDPARPRIEPVRPAAVQKPDAPRIGPRDKALATPFTSEPKPADELLRSVETALKSVEDRLGHKLVQIQKVLSDLEVRTEAQAKQQAAQPTEKRGPIGIDEDIDQISRTLRRTLVEMFERSGERVAAPLAKVQRYLEEIGKRALGEAPGLVEHVANCGTGLTDVLCDLGVDRFDAEDDELFDPMIHQCVGEEHREDREDGLVNRSVSPGYRSPTGHVLLPALVIVNRR